MGYHFFKQNQKIINRSHSLFLEQLCSQEPESEWHTDILQWIKIKVRIYQASQSVILVLSSENSWNVLLLSNLNINVEEEESFIGHIHNYTEYNQQWNVFSAFNPSKYKHTWSSGQPTLRRPGSSWGFWCLAQGSHLSCGQFLLETRFESTNSGYKSNALSIRPRLP